MHRRAAGHALLDCEQSDRVGKLAETKTTFDVESKGEYLGANGKRTLSSSVCEALWGHLPTRLGNTVGRVLVLALCPDSPVLCFYVPVQFGHELIKRLWFILFLDSIAQVAHPF
jgi:hypothetical protein